MSKKKLYNIVDPFSYPRHRKIPLIMMERLYSLLLTTLMFYSAASEVQRVEPYPCPVPKPCSCSGDQIDCEGVGLTEIPKFNKINVTYYGWEIYLDENNISEIPSKAFVNLTVRLVDLAHNQISFIADDAFYGSEQSLDMVFIQYNRLEEIPSAFGKVPNLTSLSIHHNPIKTLPEDIMMKLPNLQFLDVGSAEMTQWSPAVRYLKALTYLTFQDLPLLDLPDDAFSGLENANFFLEFDSCNFARIPKALGVLRNMTGLILRNATTILPSNLNKDSFRGMASLYFLSIDNCTLTEVPDISELQSLTKLEITRCPISRWNSGLLPRQSLLNSVTLDDTEITEVPPVISKLKHLRDLSFGSTKITEIRKNDIAGLVNLTAIMFGFCPVRKINPEAFQDIKNITVLKLDNAKLTDFPKAIRNIHYMRYVDLSYNVIDCSCAAMGFMKGWKGIGKTYVEGECHNIRMQINDFLYHEVNKC